MPCSGRKGAPVIRVSLREAESRLGRLMQDAAAGEEVIIAGTGGSSVRLVPVPQEDRGAPKRIGRGLDRFIGTWTVAQEEEVLNATAIFEQVDESFWQ